MDVTPSSRNVSSVSVVQKEITAKTPKSTGGTLTQHRQARGFVGVTITRRRSFLTHRFGRRTQSATKASPNLNWWIPVFSKGIVTGRLRRTTPKHHLMTYACVSAFVTRDPIRLSFTCFRLCGSAIAGYGRLASRGRLSGQL